MKFKDLSHISRMTEKEQAASRGVHAVTVMEAPMQETRIPVHSETTDSSLAKTCTRREISRKNAYKY